MDCLAELDLLESAVDGEMPPNKTTAPRMLANPGRDAKLPMWLQVVGVVLLPFVGFAFWSGHLGSDVDHLQKDVARIDGRLDDIQGSLLTLRAAQSPQKVLQELGALQPRQLSKALSALQKITDQSASAVAPQPSTLRDVAGKLQLVNEATPDYWTTVQRFIRFASAGLSPDVPPPGTQTNLRISNNVGAIALGVQKNCVVELDGGDVGPVRFENCRVRFTQNPVRFLNVTFVNCVFEMPDTASPSPYLKRASQILLASDLRSFSINGPV